MMKPFGKMGADWIYEGRLREFQLRDASAQALKVLIAMAMLKGELGKRAKKYLASFPASVSMIEETAHVNRNDAVRALRFLRERGFTQLDAEARPPRSVSPLCRMYRFAP